MGNIFSGLGFQVFPQRVQTPDVHGLLHLLGHDHLDEEEAVAMEAREDELLGLIPTDGTLDRVVITRHREEEGA